MVRVEQLSFSYFLQSSTCLFVDLIGNTVMAWSRRANADFDRAISLFLPQPEEEEEEQVPGEHRRDVLVVENLATRKQYARTSIQGAAARSQGTHGRRLQEQGCTRVGTVA